MNNGAGAVHVGAYSGEIHIANWFISDTQCKCDLLTLDNAFDNEYASHLLSGKVVLLVLALGIILARVHETIRISQLTSIGL